jgi:glycine amidinotransferase
LVNVANRNHILGYKWLQRTFGSEFTFHKITRLADSHIDSVVLPLRPGVLLVRSPQSVELLPEALHKWKILYAPESDEARFPKYDGALLALASKYIDMNVLSLSPDTVLVNSLYPELIRLLERNNFTVIPIRHRHRRLVGGGFHCFTLDCYRDSEYESYF